MSLSPRSRDQPPNGLPGLTVISKALEDTVIVVTASGEIDMAGTPALAAELEVVSQSPAPTVVLVDLSGVTFMDSSGVNALLAAHKEAQASSAHLRIYGANSTVSRPLELTGMHEFLEVYDTQEAALADLPTS